MNITRDTPTGTEVISKRYGSGIIGEVNVVGREDWYMIVSHASGSRAYVSWECTDHQPISMLRVKSNLITEL